MAVPIGYNKDKPDKAHKCRVLRVCPYSFSTKNGPETGVTGGGEKPELHLKDKF